jgi:hypothetical protein
MLWISISVDIGRKDFIASLRGAIPNFEFKTDKIKVKSTKYQFQSWSEMMAAKYYEDKMADNTRQGLTSIENR